MADVQALAEAYRRDHGVWPSRVTGPLPLLLSAKTLARNRLQRMYANADAGR